MPFEKDILAIAEKIEEKHRWAGFLIGAFAVYCILLAFGVVVIKYFHIP